MPIYSCSCLKKSLRCFSKTFLISWNGEDYDYTDVLILSNEYSHLPKPYGEESFICKVYNPVTQTILYAPNTVVHCNMIHLSLNHRLYDLAQRKNEERKAIKDAFAQCLSKKLCDDIVGYILRFC